MVTSLPYPTRHRFRETRSVKTMQKNNDKNKHAQNGDYYTTIISTPDGAASLFCALGKHRWSKIRTAHSSCAYGDDDYYSKKCLDCGEIRIEYK